MNGLELKSELESNEKRLLQIDTCLGVGSTGRITESIAQLAQSHGWECYIVHGARYVKRPSCMKDIQSVSIMGEYMHYALGLLFDNHGLCSTLATKRVVEQIKEIKPTVIHMHCVHGYYLNYRVLFEYLARTDIPLIWTFHDCWAFTGHCAYFDQVECDKWIKGCDAPCPAKGNYPKSLALDRTRRNFEQKRKFFTAVENKLTIVPVSYWLEGFVKKSFLHNAKIQTIHNGINLSVFKPHNSNTLRNRLGLANKKVVLGVALPWVPRKGLKDMLVLSEKLQADEYQVILVGLDDKQLRGLPKSVVGIKRTNSANELAEFYSLASVFVNPTYEDNFPTTNLEALACGTPVVTYRTGGSPESIDDETGRVVEQGDLDGLADAVVEISERVKNTDIRSKCTKRASALYDAKITFNKYMDMYKELSSVKAAAGHRVG